MARRGWQPRGGSRRSSTSASWVDSGAGSRGGSRRSSTSTSGADLGEYEALREEDGQKKQEF